MLTGEMRQFLSLASLTSSSKNLFPKDKMESFIQPKPFNTRKRFNLFSFVLIMMRKKVESVGTKKNEIFQVWMKCPTHSQLDKTILDTRGDDHIKPGEKFSIFC